ncbi:hypothetical protein KP509_07G067200 [Ceratopteris richardii]|uniref:PHD-type domain-containing protein n=1 Tax=Ceratopteris richardii TaxID=49495 RepID=A0A8T2UFF6_CERRI|nr:hypothetical protein KP509_07G067200 [Ceratopteris richardii]
MSGPSSKICDGHLDGAISSRNYRRKHNCPRDYGNARNSLYFSSNSSPYKRKTCTHRSSLENIGTRSNIRRSRRTFFDKAHLNIPVCPMSYYIGDSVRKRRLDFREHGREMPQKRLKASNLSCDVESSKSKRSKEMVSHKYRTVDSIQRSGIAHIEKQKDIDSSDVRSRRSSRIDNSRLSSTLEINGTRSKRRDSTSSYDESSEDWTQEHVLEPRKVEKRKGLDELHKMEDTSLVKGRRKETKRYKRVDNNSDVGLEKVHIDYDAQPNSHPAGASQRSMSSSEDFNSTPARSGPEKRSEQIFTGQSSDNQRIHNAASIKVLLSVGQRSQQQIGLEDKGISNDVDGANETSNRLNPLGPSLDASKSIKLKVSESLVSGGSEQVALPIAEGMEPLEVHSACGQLNEIGSVNHEIKLNVIKERKCGLCGGDSRGEPAKYLLPVSTKRKDGQTSKDDQTAPLYSEWDAFGNEPGWLGPLLGPLGDKFGIAGVWVHQECAIWSPEVYFAGIGHIKNIRAALRRGKFLKCTRCGRPGATIGCRIKRCPRTYHLPCARFEGCYFDPKKFLMACDEHLHYFLPRLPGRRLRRNSLNIGRIRLKRQVNEWRKKAQKAAQLDAETEEKWQEKAGVDEEFLRREHKRFQRDIARVAPVMVGGGSGEYISDGWESIAGSENVVQCLKEMVIIPLLYPEAFARLGVSPPQGVLLYGHPGTGKTLAVKALVGACAKGHKQIAYFARKGADCLGKYAGDAERQLRMLFYLAEKHQPSIIFFDEIDGLAPTRSQHQDQTQKSVVSTLLALMDGIKSRGSVVVIGATNRPDALDPALRRPGRFDREIYFPLPSLLDRTAILNLQTRNWQIPQKKEIISLLANRTIGFAGADLQALCAQAVINSLRRTVSIDQLIAFASKQGNTPSLPVLSVNAVDWATALEQVSPPCSSRSAKAALSTVTCGPLPFHWLHVFLWSMTELIISLHLDKRATLPPVLDRLAMSLEETLKSRLGESWIAEFNMHRSSTEFHSDSKELEASLENIFLMTGMVSNQEVTNPLISAMKNVVYEGSKFRVMLSGKDRSWLDHFAAWLLFGFEGFVELCNLNITTMLQEGAGDISQGLIHILGTIQNKSPCVLFMPQLECWAIESTVVDSSDDYIEEEMRVSHCWNIFIQQVNLLPASLQIIFVASSTSSKDDIPHEIVEFFWGSELSVLSSKDNTSRSSVLHDGWWSYHRSIPSSWIEASSVIDMKRILMRAADGFSSLLCQKVLHHGRLAEQTLPNEVSDLAREVMPAESQEPSTPYRGFRHDVIEQNIGRDLDGSSSPPGLNDTFVGIGYKMEPGHSVSVASKHVHGVGNQSDVYSSQWTYVSVSISMIGYELLYNPDLKELRHVTSKLREGPSFRTEFLVRMKSPELNGNTEQSDHPDNIILRGLNAVGLRAYCGKYLKPRDVAEGVKEVVELLMKRIDAKVNHGKDREHYSHLFHQAAALQDKTFLWAYNLRRFDLAASRDQGIIEESSDQRAKIEDKCGPSASKVLPGVGKQMSILRTPSIATDSVQPSHCLELKAQVSGIKRADGSTSYGYEQVTAINTQSSGSMLHSNNTLTRNEQQLLGADEMFGMRCPSCLRKVSWALRKLFRKVWKSRGSKLCLDIVDEVIGICTSALAIELDQVLESRPWDILTTRSSCKNSCICRSTSDKGKIGTDSKSNKMKSKLMSCSESDSNFGNQSYMCLCSLTKFILHFPTTMESLADEKL